MTDAELAHTKELAFWMTERVFMNPISAKFLNEDWRKAFPDEVAVAERMKALVEALEKAQQHETQASEMAVQLSKRLTAAEKRIAELDSRAVKLPQRHSMLLREDFNEDYHTEMAYKADELQASLAVAGIKVEAE